MIPPLPLLLAALLAIGAAGWGGYQHGYKVARAEVTAHWIEVVQGLNDRAAEAQAQQEALQANWKGRYERAVQRQAEEQARVQRLGRELQSARTERDGLRAQIDGFARGPAEGDDSFAAARDRAATLGDVLDGVLQDLERRTLQAETHAADVRSLLGAWPTTPPDVK